MIQYNNSILKINDFKLDDSDITLNLQSDISCDFVGILRLSNDTIKSIPFVNIGSHYTARLIITEEDFKYLNKVEFSLMVIEGETLSTTSSVEVPVDIAKIKLNLKIKYSKEIQELTIKLTQVSKTLNDLLQKGTINGINILGYEYVKPGMVPIAIDDKGNCMFQYPLANIISELNGLKTADGTLKLEAKNIPSGKTDVEARLNTISTTVTELGKHIQGLANTVKELSAKVGELDYKIASHLDTSIV